MQIEICKQAQTAIKAAKNRHNWGRWMTRRYAEKRGVAANVLRAALQCEAMARAGLI